jgi:hypothetical protein
MGTNISEENSLCLGYYPIHCAILLYFGLWRYTWVHTVSDEHRFQMNREDLPKQCESIKICIEDAMVSVREEFT